MLGEHFSRDEQIAPRRQGVHATIQRQALDAAHRLARAYRRGYYQGITGDWRSWLARQHDTLEVTGSSPVSPICCKSRRTQGKRTLPRKALKTLHIHAKRG